MQIYNSNKKYFVQVTVPKLLQRNNQFSRHYNKRINTQGQKRASEKDQARFIEKHTEYQNTVKRSLIRTVILARLTGESTIVRRSSLSLYKELCQTFGLDEKGVREKSVTLEIEEADEICRNVVDWLNEKGFDFANAGMHKRIRKATGFEFIEGLPDDEMEGKTLINCKSSLSENQIEMANYIEENEEKVLAMLSEAIMDDFNRTLPFYELLLATKAGEKSWFPSPEQVINPHDYFTCNKIYLSQKYPMIGIEGEILWFPDLKFGATIEPDVSVIISTNPSEARQ